MKVKQLKWIKGSDCLRGCLDDGVGNIAVIGLNKKEHRGKYMRIMGVPVKANRIGLHKDIVEAKEVAQKLFEDFVAECVEK
jgi:hypothetical protein